MGVARQSAALADYGLKQASKSDRVRVSGQYPRPRTTDADQRPSSSFFSSPDWNISFMMSQPPMNSPRM